MNLKAKALNDIHKALRKRNRRDFAYAFSLFCTLYGISYKENQDEKEIYYAALDLFQKKEKKDMMKTFGDVQEIVYKAIGNFYYQVWSRDHVRPIFRVLKF